MVTPDRSASDSIASTSSMAWGSPKEAGVPSTTYASPASAPIAARSERAAARALCPTSPGEWVSRPKCTPSTIASTDVTATPPARTTAASSPLASSTRSLRTRRIRSNSRIRSRSGMS